VFFAEGAGAAFFRSGKLRVYINVTPESGPGNAQGPGSAVLDADAAGAAELRINLRFRPQGAFYRDAELPPGVAHRSARANPAADSALNAAYGHNFVALSPFAGNGENRAVPGTGGTARTTFTDLECH